MICSIRITGCSKSNYCRISSRTADKRQCDFLGGPLYFLSELRVAFERTLAEQVDSFIVPDNAPLYVAIGAAMLSDESRLVDLKERVERFNESDKIGSDVLTMSPLFADQSEKDVFDARHAKAQSRNMK